MKKYIVFGALSSLFLSPALALATSYNMRAIEIFLIVTIFDEIILFVVLPILIIFLIVRVIKYRKTSLEDPLKEKRKSKIYKTILTIFIFLVLVIFLPKGPGSEPCGFNMESSCPVSFRAMLYRLGILETDLSSTKCPPGYVAIAYKGRPMCVDELSYRLYH